MVIYWYKGSKVASEAVIFVSRPICTARKKMGKPLNTWSRYYCCCRHDCNLGSCFPGGREEASSDYRQAVPLSLWAIGAVFILHKMLSYRVALESHPAAATSGNTTLVYK